MAITMLLGPEMKHMGGHHVIIYAADVEPPPSCTASLKVPAVNSESDWQAGSLHDQLSRPTKAHRRQRDDAATTPHRRQRKSAAPAAAAAPSQPPDQHRAGQRAP